MKFPENVKYTTAHEWIRIEGQEAYVGITDYAQDQLGEVVFVDIDTEGESIRKNEKFGSIEAVKTTNDLFMPIEAEVLEINTLLEEHPELVNTDPYGEGWIIKVKPLDMSQWEELLTADTYQKHIGIEV